MKQSRYTSKKPDNQGVVNYTEEESTVWHDLFIRQMELLPTRACSEYLKGIDTLGLKADHIPQLPEINQRLRALSGWEVAPVPALIDFQAFFELMSEKKFPAATFIRVKEDMDYLQEPDIFHEIFGHCPLLTLPMYADFMHEYAKLGLQASHQDRVLLARLYWFTVEFGLIETEDGLRIYGGGILSSYGESKYCLESDKPILKLLEPIEAFRTPYRIDIYQPLYFIIKDLSELYHLVKRDLMKDITQARQLGMYAPLFQPKAKSDEGRRY